MAGFIDLGKNVARPTLASLKGPKSPASSRLAIMVLLKAVSVHGKLCMTCRMPFDASRLACPIVALPTSTIVLELCENCVHKHVVCCTACHGVVMCVVA